MQGRAPSGCRSWEASSPSCSWCRPGRRTPGRRRWIRRGPGPKTTPLPPCSRSVSAGCREHRAATVRDVGLELGAVPQLGDLRANHGPDHHLLRPAPPHRPPGAHDVPVHLEVVHRHHRLVALGNEIDDPRRDSDPEAGRNREETLREIGLTT